MTLPMQDVSAVADAIRKMHAVFHDPNYYIEAANMFDGYDYQIYLSDGQDAYAVLTDNLKVHLERHSPNAEKLIMLIYEVFDILERNGVERDILQIK